MARPTNLQHVPRPTESFGCTAISLPLGPMLQQFELRFACDTIDRLWADTEVVDIEGLLRETELTPDCLAMASSFAYVEVPPRARLTWTRPGLRRLANDAYDYADDQGGWRSWREDLEEVAVVASRELVGTIEDTIRQTCGKAGPLAARKVLEMIREALRNQILAWQSEQKKYSWQPDRSANLRQAAAELRGVAEPTRLLTSVLGRLRPKASIKRALTDSDKDRVTAQHDMIESAIRLRYGYDLMHYKSAAADLTLHRLENIATELSQYEEYFGQLRRSFDETPSLPKAPAYEIRIVESIDATIDRSTRRTLLDVYFEKSALAGATPDRLAETLCTQGLALDYETAKPGNWCRKDFKEVRRCFMSTVRQYLGSHDPDQLLDTSNPTTAVEQIAAVTLTHPELQGLVKPLMRELARRSRPYAEVHPIANFEPTTNRYLLCHPSQRTTLEKWLANFAKPANVPHSPESLAEFGVQTPFMAILVQMTFGLPGYAQPSYIRGRYHGQLLRGLGRHEALFNEEEAIESRLLHERSDEIEDCIEMFDALVASTALQPLAGDGNGFVLSRPEQTVDYLFRETNIEPCWRPASSFHELVKQSSFRSHVERHYQVAGWHDLCAGLADHFDEDFVAAKLASVGVVEANDVGQYRMAGKPPQDIVLAPVDLYSKTSGRLAGMNREKLIALLQRDDWFYNVMFWRVVDALAQRRISRAEVPVFVRRYVDRHLSELRSC